MNVLLETKNLTKTYDHEHGIHDINIVVEQGDVYGFLGPNGSGKTTTIRTILNLIHLESGSVTINGEDIKENFEQAIQQVGAIVETPTFFEYLTGRENIKVISKLYKDVNKDRINEVLKLVGLEERADDKVKTYSLGMKQRLGIARALLQKPKLVILDEPTNGLDPQGMKEVRDMIIRLAKEEHITFFISTHLLNEVESMCNKVGILKNGRMIAQGKVNELLAEDMETVEVQTKDVEAVVKMASKNDFIRDLEEFHYGLTIKIDKGYSSELIHTLVKHGINIDYVIPKSQSLEQYFFGVTKGEDSDVK